MENNNFNKELKLFRKVNNLLYNKYGDSINNYNKQRISYLIKLKNSNLLINFQECTVYDDIEEYHKRYYYKWESKNKLKEFFDYYLNYLIFFCRPMLINIYCNNLLHYCNDVKADIFYKNNYKKQEDGNNNDNENKKENNNNSEDNKSDDNLKKEKEKVNIIIFDKETQNNIDNSSIIISSIHRINEEEQNTSYTQKMKINDNYITLRNTKENLLEIVKDIKINNNIKEYNSNNQKLKEKSLLNPYSSINHKVRKNNIFEDGYIVMINNYIQNKRKNDSGKEKVKFFKIIKNFNKNKSENKNNQIININNVKEKEQDNYNSLKNKKLKKIDINYNKFKSNIYKLIKKNLINFKYKKTNNYSNQNLEINNIKNSNININEKRFSINNNISKYQPKIIDIKRNSFINTTNYFRNNISMINNKSKNTKTISINKIKNSNIQSNKKSQIYNNKSNNNSNKLIKNIQKGRNIKKQSLNSYNFNKKPLNNINLLQTYLKNCPNLKRLSRSKPLLKEKTKPFYNSTEQLKTFSVRKKDNKKTAYYDKILGVINNIKNNYNHNYNTSNNISINEKMPKTNKKVIPKKIINKSKSNSIIKRNGELIYPKKISIRNKKEFRLNVNLNLHSIFININNSSNYQRNNNESLNNHKKKVKLNCFFCDNCNINGKSMKIQRTKKIIKDDSYKNKTQSYKNKKKTKNKIKKKKMDKIKGINSFIHTNTNIHIKHTKEEKDIILKRNNTTFKEKKSNLNSLGNASSKISLSINKKNNNNKIKIVDEKNKIYNNKNIKK